MSDIKSLQEKIAKFVEERDWSQFHNPKDLAISLSLEASEVLEHFQWKNHEEMAQHVKDNREDVEDELADVLYWVLLMANNLDIDVVAASERKLLKNAKKYPVVKAKGNHKKYTDL
ncbi:MAG TPA: nucleotide pyrophosphohydrolase [Candidatus Saccharimonadales bacterium]|nr:nucleotide pyrophosphohydrolase [Candidatus Saccharimonadales bacterium]